MRLKPEPRKQLLSDIERPWTKIMTAMSPIEEK